MRNLFFTLTLFLISQGLSAQSETRFYAEANKSEVAVGEPLKITFNLENGKNSSKFSPPDWEKAGFLLLGSSQSSNISIMNGQSSSSAAYNYTVTPLEEGTWTIPSVSIKNGDGELSTEAITIIALPNPNGEQPKRSTAPAPREPKKRFKTVRI